MGATSLAFECPSTAGQKKEYLDELNQLSIIGFVGKNAETKYLPNGTPVTKFSVATKRSWKDENDEWKVKTQWHNVVAFGKTFAQLTERLVKGAHVFVQGELTTREYDRSVNISAGKGKSIEHTIQQLVVELRAEMIRTLDRPADATESSAEEAPNRGLNILNRCAWNRTTLVDHNGRKPRRAFLFTWRLLIFSRQAQRHRALWTSSLLRLHNNAQ